MSAQPAGHWRRICRQGERGRQQCWKLSRGCSEPQDTGAQRGRHSDANRQRRPKRAPPGVCIMSGLQL